MESRARGGVTEGWTDRPENFDAPEGAGRQLPVSGSSGERGFCSEAKPRDSLYEDLERAGGGPRCCGSAGGISKEEPSQGGEGRQGGEAAPELREPDLFLQLA